MHQFHWDEVQNLRKETDEYKIKYKAKQANNKHKILVSIMGQDVRGGQADGLKIISNVLIFRIYEEILC